MKGLILGSGATLALVGVGLFWWSGRAEVERAAPPPMAQEVKPLAPEVPPSNAGTAVGPAPPVASELSKEQQRFFRYDRNRDWRISRVEMLSTRTEGFRKLDKDGNNLLDFEEWAVATVDKFDRADGDGNRELTPAEFARTAPKPAKKRSCAC